MIRSSVATRIRDAAADLLDEGLPPITERLLSRLPSVRNLSRYALGATQLFLGPAIQEPLVHDYKRCSDPQLSCHNSSAVENTCCFNAPGGQMLLTQLWDTHPVTGPVDSWTIHGLWPDRCDGTYEAYCDPSRNYRNITQIIAAATFPNKAELITNMTTYWKDFRGHDETFWEHEWSKHGTCVSTLEPRCYASHTPTEEVVDFFRATVSLFHTRPTYTWLLAAGIPPSHTTTYSSATIQAALSARHGAPVTLGCRAGALTEVWYHFNVRGPVQSGVFVSAQPDGGKSTCPRNGVRYLPKSPPGGGHSTTTGTTTTATTTGGDTRPTGPPPPPFSGRGYLNVRPRGAVSPRGCLISRGTWYTSGACATFTAERAPSGVGDGEGAGGGFTLRSRRGACAVLRGKMACGPKIKEPTVFTAVDEGEEKGEGGSARKLAFEGSAVFAADRVPAGRRQEAVFAGGAAGGRAVNLTVVWERV